MAVEVASELVKTPPSNIEALYDLKANLQEALALLEDQKDKKLDDWGEPIVLEIGICPLLDD
ncbi:6832_t:CDS:2 [Ambispora gerdemannii]|uniref:6832_t:CDS:1 n=1 Tax=Ambispora gerdemannii TaxID=144530 RepID=A0A9N9D925_9GLOM|nr:6832_t:CDS:2 [Ambispora gerdemannii]